jgi:PAS domain S-box-containing protein
MLIIALSFLVILLLSLLFVRKSLLPLTQLKNATQWIVGGNFSHAVEIASGDEFEELADSFNRMTQKLRQQFNELRLIAAIGNFSAGIPNTVELIQAIMNAIQNLLPFDRAALLLLNETQSRLVYRAGFGCNAGQKEALAIFVGSRRTMRANNPIEKAFVTQEPVLTGSENNPGASNYDKTVLSVPIVYENQSNGVLLLEGALPKEPTVTLAPEFWMGLGSQIAVSLSNAASFQKIQESEARFRKSFENAASGMALVSTEGNILTANNYLLKMLGYEEREMLAKKLEDISHPGHFLAEQSVLQRLNDQELEFDIYEKKFIHKKGHVVWSLVSTSLLFAADQTPLYYIMQIQNLSELKHAEKIQKELENRLEKKGRSH